MHRETSTLRAYDEPRRTLDERKVVRRLAAAPQAPTSLQATVASRVAAQLRSEIRTGVLEAGSPLRQNDIAARLGVSSTPVREAFQTLEREGLVQRSDRRGVVVFRPTIKDLINSYEIRASLEALAVRKAVPNLTEQDLRDLERLTRRMAQRATFDEKFMELNTAFHRQIAQRSGNRRLVDLISAEQMATTAYVMYLGVDERSSEAAITEHGEIFDAVLRGDAARAASAMGAHLSARVDALERRLRTNPA